MPRDAIGLRCRIEPLGSEAGAIGAPGSERFGPEHRLRQRKEYLRCYANGRRGYGRWVVVFALDRGDGAPWRLGIAVPRKVGNAVVRNRLSRRVREFFRRRGVRWPAGWDFVVNCRHHAAAATGRELMADLIQILGRLGFDPEPSSPEPSRSCE